MTITAKYAGRCARCGRAITPGQQIEWSRGQRPYHTACAEAAGTPAAELAGVQGPIAGARGGVRHDARRTNRRPGQCDHCGAYLQVGQGRLEYCVEDSGCMIHHDHGGYHVYCLDPDACQARRTAREAAARQRQQRAAALKALTIEVEGASEPVVAWPPQGRVYTRGGEPVVAARVYEECWVATADAIYWVHPYPTLDDSWDVRYWQLSEEHARRARELGIEGGAE